MILLLRRKTYIAAFFCAAAACAAVALGCGINTAIRSFASASQDPVVIIDPGHGGADGGAEGGGLEEKTLNLDISLRLKDMLQFFGYTVVMTRTEDASTGGSGGFNKRKDLNARAKLADAHAGAPFISVHMNKFDDDAPWGTQVFYSGNHESSKPLALCLQEEVRGLLQPKNHRQIKPAPGSVFLMKAVKNPAVIVECGFLSNPGEVSLLKDEKYRSELAFAIACGYLRYETGEGGGENEGSVLRPGAAEDTAGAAS